jgi:hypothetical protein
MAKGFVPIPESKVKIQPTDEDDLQYLEKTYGKVAKVFFDWRKSLPKTEPNDPLKSYLEIGQPYVNMRALNLLAQHYKDGNLEKESKSINFILNVKEEDLNTLITNLKKFEQTNSIVDKVQKMRDSEVDNPKEKNNKPKN